MKLHCNVEVHYRTHAEYLHINSTKKRSHRSILAFFKKPNENNNPCLLLQTQGNKQGIKYKVIYKNFNHMNHLYFSSFMKQVDILHMYTLYINLYLISRLFTI